RKKLEVTVPTRLHRFFSGHFVAACIDESVIVGHQGGNLFKIVRINRSCEVSDGFHTQIKIASSVARVFLSNRAPKLSPQEQFAISFGFVTLNPPFGRSSL